jgi:3-methyladenine DNA glycosylase AlkD
VSSGTPACYAEGVTALAEATMVRLRDAFAGAADPERAVAMAAYMRDQFPFLGIPSPAQRRLAMTALRALPSPDEADVVAFTTVCWAASEREYQYAACDYAIRHVRRCGETFLDHTRILLTTKSWWDTVDALAANVVGPLVRAYPPLVAVMDDWIDGDDVWLVRTAIIHQLHARDRTDATRLFGYCARRAGDREFFVRKAIGWALREHSKTDAAAVRQFVATHPELSPLSAREALKWLQRRELV